MRGLSQRLLVGTCTYNVATAFLQPATRVAPRKAVHFALNEKIKTDPLDDVQQRQPEIASADILAEMISSTSPSEFVQEMENDISAHVQSIFTEAESESKITPQDQAREISTQEDLQAVWEASSEAAAAAEASLSPQLKEQLANSTTAGVIVGPVHSEQLVPKEAPEILKAAAVVGEAITVPEFETPSMAKILKFAIPAIGVWLCGPLLSLIDTSAVGLFSGTVHQAALNPAVAVTEYAALLIAFMYTGTTNLVAAAQESDRGTTDKPRTTKTLIGAMRLSTFVGAGLGAILFVFARPLLKAIIGNDAISPAVFAAAMKYVRIRALGMPAAAIIGSTQAACLGMQDIRSPLYVLVAAAVVNLFGDMLFVSQKHALLGGAAGAAWATVLSQYAAVTLFVRWLTHKPTGQASPKVVNLSKAILELTSSKFQNSEGGSKRRMQLKDTLQSLAQRLVNSSSNGDTGKSKPSVVSNLWSKASSIRKNKAPATPPVKKKLESSVTVRGFLQNKFKTSDLFTPPNAETREEFTPYLLPVTTTQVGRVSGYVAMSHVVASSLGTASMAAQQVIVSLFYCLTPIADSLSLTAQSFLPQISEKKASPAKAKALRRIGTSFAQAGLVFGGGMMAAVSAIPLLSGFFTSDPAVISMVNSVVPLLLTFFGLHGVLCAAEGVLLGQKDLGYVGKMYGAFFFAMPYFMLRLKRAALAGSQSVGLTSVWGVFVGYQIFRCAAWVARVLLLQRKAHRDGHRSLADLAP